MSGEPLFGSVDNSKRHRLAELHKPLEPANVVEKLTGPTDDPHRGPLKHGDIIWAICFLTDLGQGGFALLRELRVPPLHSFENFNRKKVQRMHAPLRISKPSEEKMVQGAQCTHCCRRRSREEQSTSQPP